MGTLENMLAYNYEFRDPIHGLIPVNKAEKLLIDSEPFQRLRNIKQLGTSYKIYHGAEHSRFGHSIGVMHIVGRVFDAIWNQPASKLRTIWNEDEFKKYKQIARIAALLHDIRHGPFSHVGENEEYGLFKKMNDVDNQERTGHEVYSRLIVRDLLGGKIEKNFKDLDVKANDVLTVFLGQSTDRHHRFIDELISGQLDADKMDYLLRDSHYCGVQYGVYDIEKLINSLTICCSKYDQWQLGVGSDGVHVVEEFVFARYWMFLQVYFHKTRRIYDYYVSKALKEMYPFGYPTDLNEYLKIHDIKIMESFRSEGTSSSWVKAYFCRPYLKEAFVSKPLQEVDEEKDRIAWVMQQVEENYEGKIELYMDQAKGKTAKTLIDIKKFLEEAEGNNEAEENDEKLPAIPVVDKFTGRVFPIQNISVPLASVSGKKINVLRVYTTEEHRDEVRNFCHQKFYEDYDEYLDKLLEAKAYVDQETKKQKERLKKYMND